VLAVKQQQQKTRLDDDSFIHSFIHENDNPGNNHILFLVVYRGMKNHSRNDKLPKRRIKKER